MTKEGRIASNHTSFSSGYPYFCYTLDIIGRCQPQIISSNTALKKNIDCQVQSDVGDVLLPMEEPLQASTPWRFQRTILLAGQTRSSRFFH